MPDPWRKRVEIGEAVLYEIIYADPPWRYQDKNCNGAAAQQYETMNLADIKALPVSNIVAPNAVLFLWATWPLIRGAFEVIEAWGFTYKSIGFNWIKRNPGDQGYFFGLGRWTRGNAEPCLLATRGKPKRVNAAISQLIFEPVGRHSKKPDLVRERIVQLMGDKPRIELFARKRTAGWAVWGNEVPPGPPKGRPVQLELGGA